MENMRTRTAVGNAFYETWNDFRWYARRKGNANTKALKDALGTWTRLLAPFAPHLCEEVWNIMGEKTFISTSLWPEYDENRIDTGAEESENLIKNVLEDTQNIINATKITPKNIYYYAAADWKWKAYKKALAASAVKTVAMAELMKDLMTDKELKVKAKQIAKFAPQLLLEVNRMPNDKKQKQLHIDKMDEKTTLREATDFFEREFKARIKVQDEEDVQRYDPKSRAELARPYRPAIFIE
jgi:leucyl-tRNA synthetase